MSAFAFFPIAAAAKGPIIVVKVRCYTNNSD